MSNNNYNYNQNNYNSYGNTNLAYDFSAFEVERKKRVEVPAPNSYGKLRLAEDPQPKTVEGLKAEEKLGMKRAVSAVLVAVLCFGMLGMMVNSFVKKNELNQDIISKQKLLAQQETEYARLSVLLNSMASPEKVEEYATNELGMIQLKNGQTTYISVAQGDEKSDVQSELINNVPKE